MQHYWKGFTVLDFCCAFTSSCDRVLQIFCDSVKKKLSLYLYIYHYVGHFCLNLLAFYYCIQDIFVFNWTVCPTVGYSYRVSEMKKWNEVTWISLLTSIDFINFNNFMILVYNLSHSKNFVLLTVFCFLSRIACNFACSLWTLWLLYNTIITTAEMLVSDDT